MCTPLGCVAIERERASTLGRERKLQRQGERDNKKTLKLLIVPCFIACTHMNNRLVRSHE